MHLVKQIKFGLEADMYYPFNTCVVVVPKEKSIVRELYYLSHKSA